MKRINIHEIIGGIVIIVGTWYIISLAPQPVNSAIAGVRIFCTVFGLIMIVHGVFIPTKSKDEERE